MSVEAESGIVVDVSGQWRVGYLGFPHDVVEAKLISPGSLADLPPPSILKQDDCWCVPPEYHSVFSKTVVRGVAFGVVSSHLFFDY